MSLSDINDPDSIVKAVEEFDELGRENFLKKYGFRKARLYYLDINDRYYDSKAIVGVAHKYISSEGKPLKSGKFVGGEETVAKLLSQLGYKVVKLPKAKTEPSSFPITAYSWIALSENLFIKTMDKSAFLHRGTGIPYLFKKLLGIEEITPARRIEVKLRYKGTEYNAHFEMTKSQRIRLMWSNDFSVLLNNTFPEWAVAFAEGNVLKTEHPKIIFNKVDSRQTEFDIKLSAKSKGGVASTHFRIKRNNSVVFNHLSL